MERKGDVPSEQPATHSQDIFKFFSGKYRFILICSCINHCNKEQLKTKEYAEREEQHWLTAVS